jgi:hypothetical protein
VPSIGWAWKEVPKEDLDKDKKPKNRKEERNLPKTMDTNEAHTIGAIKDSVYCKRQPSASYGVKLTGTLEQHEGYRRANTKQKDFLQDSSNHEGEKTGERTYLDLKND